MTRDDLRALFWSNLESMPPAMQPDVEFVVASTAQAPRYFPGVRDFAFCQARGRGRSRIVVSPALVAQSRDRVLGILRHELGHAIDNDRNTKAATGVDWRAYRPERRADELARVAFGAPIYYDADDVQTTAAHDADGRPNRDVRPSHLPR